MCNCVVVVVMIDGELRGGLDLTVLQDAHGQHMGMLLRSAAKRALRFRRRWRRRSRKILLGRLLQHVLLGIDEDKARRYTGQITDKDITFEIFVHSRLGTIKPLG